MVDTFAHATYIYAAKPSQLTTVAFENVAWNTTGKRCTVDMLKYFATLKAALSGIIFLVAASSDRYLTLAEKMLLVSMYVS